MTQSFDTYWNAAAKAAETIYWPEPGDIIEFKSGQVFFITGKAILTPSTGCFLLVQSAYCDGEETQIAHLPQYMADSKITWIFKNGEKV